MDLPFIVGLCPTYNHPELLANSVALWEAQDYPAERRLLLILDDGGSFAAQSGATWRLLCSPSRSPSLPAKYNHLAAYGADADAYVVWEDDDIYLPGYISAHARTFADCELSKPAVVLSDYPGQLVEEPAAGRFHSSLGFRRELLERIGGWPETKRADFDQQIIARLQHEARSAGDPFDGGPIEYVYRWHTGAHHGQSYMRAPDDVDWYDRAGGQMPPHIGKLTPRLDERTKRILAELERA
jgi:hypothetical protein